MYHGAGGAKITTPLRTAHKDKVEQYTISTPALLRLIPYSFIQPAIGTSLALAS